MTQVPVPGFPLPQAIATPGMAACLLCGTEWPGTPKGRRARARHVNSAPAWCAAAHRDRRRAWQRELRRQKRAILDASPEQQRALLAGWARSARQRAIAEQERILAGLHHRVALKPPAAI